VKSRYSTIPTVPVARTPDGHWRITCTGCDLNETRIYRESADLTAMEHIASHTPREQRWRE